MGPGTEKIFFRPPTPSKGGDEKEENEMGEACSTCGGRVDVYTEVWWGKLRVRAHLEDPGINGRIIIRWNFRMCDVRYGLDRSGSGQGQVAGTCECGNEPSGSIQCGEFLDWLRTCHLFKEDSVKWNK